MSTETRMLFAIARVERLVEAGVPAGYALRSIARMLELDADQLGELFRVKAAACEAARAALSAPEGGDEDEQ